MEIDQQIHEMMGLCWHEWNTLTCDKCGKHRYVAGGSENPTYSTDISAAFIVVYWLRKQGWAFACRGDSVQFVVEFYTAFSRNANQELWASADTLEEAICRAAIKTVEAHGLSGV